MNTVKNSKTAQEPDNKRVFFVILLLFLSIVTIIAAVVIVLTLQSGNSSVLAPDYAPRETEKNAEPIGDDGDSKLDQPDGGGAVSLTYAKEVRIRLSEKTAQLLFANPTKSNQDMLLQLVINDTVILQSGRLTPGNRVSELELLAGMEKRLSAGGYNGKFVVLYYDRTSGEKAMVNTEIPVTVTVTD